MSKKCTTLCSAVIAGCKSLSTAMSAIDVTSHHDVTAVGQPTDQTPDIFSIVDTTEKVIDLDVVDSTLLPSQRNTDNRPTMDDLGKAKASPQQMMDNEEEAPFFTRYAHLVPTAKSLAPESEEDELSSSSEVVNKEFDKNEFLNELHTCFSQLISRLLEKPTKKFGDKQRRKNLRDREEKHLTDDTGTGSIIM